MFITAVCVIFLIKFWKIFGKWSENFGRSPKMSSLVCSYDKQNNTRLRVDMEFLFPLVFNFICHSLSALTREKSSQTLKEKFRIDARPCII